MLWPLKSDTYEYLCSDSPSPLLLEAHHFTSQEILAVGSYRSYVYPEHLMTEIADVSFQQTPIGEFRLFLSFHKNYNVFADYLSSHSLEFEDKNPIIVMWDWSAKFIARELLKHNEFSPEIKEVIDKLLRSCREESKHKLL